ncbi:hypothetical protein COEREDRAFT_89501 [Coemansia reversa NRRL 1564]|uniref:Uncharacterized protein n=1 Tax=Coemansia reversa (strain ATCC 12441 / NRRL 1564) TaxID=763665 RepID=A0A2G5B3E6_COERN|nr:hypothetical protein COEREDRAFT_89501 [Coemansia reversa NRRL 1564]|eukprot:PIA13524.1 hypothetical protein COEREDRAFT_89501 [Coemansia reversa NRRL 1564]
MTDQISPYITPPISPQTETNVIQEEPEVSIENPWSIIFAFVLGYKKVQFKVTRDYRCLNDILDTFTDLLVSLKESNSNGDNLIQYYIEEPWITDFYTDSSCQETPFEMNTPPRDCNVDLYFTLNGSSLEKAQHLISHNDELQRFFDELETLMRDHFLETVTNELIQ